MLAFADKVQLEGTRTREDGYLVADARVARIGTQVYLGAEVGRPDLPRVTVYRPEAEVFSDAAMASFAHRPVTNDHPEEAVTADNWRQYAVGQTSDETRKDGKYLRVPLMVADRSAIESINQGKRELSAGYLCDLEWGDGVTPDGEPYNAIQTNIRGNHIAIVQNGRAGSACRIGDSAAHWGIVDPNSNLEKTMPENLRTVMVDGLSVTTTDQGAQAIDKLLGDLDRAQQEVLGLTSTHNDALKAKDTEIAKRDAVIDELKSKQLDQAAIDKLVADRGDLVALAAKISPDTPTAGLSDSDLRKAVVVAKLGGESMADKSDAYIQARFDILAEDARKDHQDSFRQTFAGGNPRPSPVDAVGDRQQAFDDLTYFDQHGQERRAN